MYQNEIVIIVIILHNQEGWKLKRAHEVQDILN